MRRKVSSLVIVEPIEYEDDNGVVLYSMPRRLCHLNKREMDAYEALGEVSTDALAEFVSLLNEKGENGVVGDELAAKRAAARTALADATFGVASYILPGLTREAFDGISNLTLTEIVKEFQTNPKAPATDAPETSGSVAT